MTRMTLTLVALVVTLFAGLGHADAQDTTAQDATAEESAAPHATVHRADRGLVVAGSVVLSLGWGLNTLGAFAGEAAIGFNSAGSDDLWAARYGLSFVPVVGPVIWGSWALAIGDHTALALFAYGDALVQAAGLAMLIAGLVGYDEPVGEIAEGVTLVPIASGNGSGLMLDVRF